MAEAGLEIDDKELQRLTKNLNEFLSRDAFRPAMKAVGAIVESQTRKRIQEDKASPEGQPWEKWSPKYAKTRKGGKSLLQDNNSLLDSLKWTLRGGRALRVGSNLVYAARHQFGFGVRGASIAFTPARPYLGLSQQDEDDVENTIVRWWLRKIERDG